MVPLSDRAIEVLNEAAKLRRDDSQDGLIFEGGKRGKPISDMTLTAYLRDHPNADEPELREALSGNICRCTGYDTIVRAALAAAEAMRGRAEP